MTLSNGKNDPIRWHNLSVEEIFKRLQTTTKGLKEEEVIKRLELYGPNLLRETKKISAIRLFLEQFNNYLIIILLFAVLLSASIGELLDAFVISIIIVFAAGLGFVQEYRAEKAIKALMAMAEPTATVIRGGKQLEVSIETVVPGDIIPVIMGDKIPADARLFESINLQTNESSLTGESVPVEKKADSFIEPEVPLGNRETMIHTGTAVTYGRGKAIVVATGMQTEFGRIAGLLESVESGKTPLQRNLDQMGKSLAKISFLLIFVIFAVGVLRSYDPLEMFVWAIALAIAVVPEALPAVVTISLAIGVQKMSKKNALMRKLPAVETLGATSVICSDKTGTLTKGEMTVRKLYVSSSEVDLTSLVQENSSIKNKETELLLLGSTLCNDTQIEKDSKESKFIGTPTEVALKVLVTGLDYIEDQLYQYPRIDEIPFTSERKMMTTVHNTPNQVLVFCKGAPEIVLTHCKRIMENGIISSMNPQKIDNLKKTIEKMAQQALRTIAISFKSIDKTYDKTRLEEDLVFLGFIGIMDPPRDGVKSVVEECRLAGIKTVMITGDHMTTALAIAQELNIAKEGQVLSGIELDALSNEQLDERIEEIEVFARVAPVHKLRIVESYSKSGHIVAMTGDGINDAPALKRADVGIAMGIKGTDVTKESADMILTDDNFVSIVGAVEEGRIMFSNIKKYLMYLLSSNLGEIILLGLAVLIGMDLPLIAIQILYVNLATDGLPALALAVDPPEGDYMHQPPRHADRSIFSRPVIFLMVLGGVWSAAINLTVFIVALEFYKMSLIEAQSLVFVSLILIQFLKAYNYRSDHQSILSYGLFTNKWLNIAVLWEIFLLLLILYIPILQIPFGTFNFGLFEWIIVLVSALTIIPVLEFGKIFVRRQMAHLPT